MRHKILLFTAILGVTLFFAPRNLFAQVTITSVSSCSSYTLTGTISGLVPTSSGITTDDVWSDVIPIGFTYNFYGVANTECIIGSNGCLGFSLSNATAYNTWPISATLMGTASSGGGGGGDIYNLIAGPWCDIYIPAGGTIMYSTVGTAPNRMFEVTYCGVAMFSCTTQWITTQTIIYETTGVAEVHIGHHTFCTSWNGGYAETGVVNATGSSATVAPGPLVEDYPNHWNATNIAWRFTPVGTTSFTVSSIPYAPIPYATGTIYWYDSATHAYIGSGTSVVVSPTVTTTYEAAVLGCKDTSKSYITIGPVSGGTTTAITGDSSICLGNTTLLSDSTTGGVWTSTDLGVATVSTSGLVTGVSGGTTIISYTFGACTSTLVVTVNTAPAITGVTTICEGTTSILSDAVTGGTWTSSNTGVATIVSTSGLVTGIAPGTSVITYVTPAGCVTTTTVNIFVLSSIDGTKTLCQGSTTALTDGSAGGTWTSANTGVATIGSATGVVTGLTGGTTNITYSTSAGCYVTAVVTVNVTPLLNVISSTNPTQCGYDDGTITITAIIPGSTDTVFYSVNGGATVSTTTIAQSDSAIVLTGLGGGVYTGFSVKIGDCTYTVNGSATLVSPYLIPMFDTAINFGCHGDTVSFTNLSSTSPTGGTLYYIWTFGDGTTDTSLNPTHIYTAQGTYTVTLVVDNHICDTAYSVVLPLLHPLVASFTMDTNLICQDKLITFTNTSIISDGYYGTFLWSFGNGVTDTNKNASYTFLNTGTYTVQLIATDWVPCHDTTSEVVQVDTISGISLSLTDTVICEGTYITFSSLYAGIGNTGNLWNFGDGTTIANTNPVIHAFDATGVFTITVTADYRACPDTSMSRTVTVIAQPSIYLGADTSICLGGVPLTLADNINAGNPLASWLWSTGQTTSSITIVAPGIYYATVNVNNCYASDTISVASNCYMDIPNAFTPNGDGVNDYFFPRQMLTKGLATFSMNIYDRWGELIFQSTSLDGRGWDGKFNGVDQPNGVFVYVIDATFIDGQKEHHQGNVTLLR